MFSKIREFVLNFRRGSYRNRSYFSSQDIEAEIVEYKRVHGLTEVQAAYLACVRNHLPFYTLRTELYDQVRHYAKTVVHFRFSFPERLTPQDVLDFDNDYQLRHRKGGGSI